jgi:hypothetical protein
VSDLEDGATILGRELVREGGVGDLEVVLDVEGVLLSRDESEGLEVSGSSGLYEEILTQRPSLTDIVYRVCVGVVCMGSRWLDRWRRAERAKIKVALNFF